MKGLQKELFHCSPMKNCKLKGLLKKQAITHCLQFQLKLPKEVQHVSSVCVIQDQSVPTDIKQLISLYEDVFQAPITLPPPWPFDHQIYLVPGAQPMNVSPYRYSPLQKKLR